MDKDFYTVKEFSKELGVSTDRVYEWLRTDRIYSIRYTKYSPYRIPKSELERMKGRAPNDIQLVKEGHLNKIHTILRDWRRDISLRRASEHDIMLSPSVESYYPVIGEKLFPHVLAHCPSINKKYKLLKNLESHLGDYHENWGDFWGDVLGMVYKYRRFTHSELNKISSAESFDIAFKIFGQLLNPNLVSAEEGSQILIDTGFAKNESESHYEVLSSSYLELFNNHHRHRILQYWTKFDSLENELIDAIENCLLSHEYTKHKCDWCP